jgi:uncharacterized protein (TIRG00374 family)
MSLSIPVLIVGIFLRSLRWVYLLDGEVSLMDPFWAQGIGFLFTNILPFRLGEPARIVALAQKSKIAIVRVTATVLVERLMDIATLVFILTLVMAHLNIPPFLIKAGLASGILLMLSFGVLLILVIFRNETRHYLERLDGWLAVQKRDWLWDKWNKLMDGLSSISSWRIFIKVAVISLFTWGAIIFFYYCVIKAFQINGTILEAGFMLVVVCFAVSLPSSPGFLGVFHYAGMQALVLPFGSKYGNEIAFSIVMTIFLFNYIFTTLQGLIALGYFGESMKSYRRILRAPQTK